MMPRTQLLPAFAILIFLASGCAHQSSPTVVPAANVFQSYDNKLSGKYAVFVQSGMWNKRVKPSSYMCSVHVFPVNADFGFQESVFQTIAGVVEQAELVRQALSPEQLHENGYKAQIAVHAGEFRPEIAFVSHFFTASANATARATIHMVAQGPEGPIFQTSVTADGFAEGNAGGLCGGGADVLGKAVGKMSGQIMERIGERVANSAKLRNIGESSEAL